MPLKLTPVTDNLNDAGGQAVLRPRRDLPDGSLDRPRRVVEIARDPGLECAHGEEREHERAESHEDHEPEDQRDAALVTKARGGTCHDAGLTSGGRGR